MDNVLLSRLYHLYHKEIYLYIYSMSRNRDLSEDLVQETFLKALLSLPENHANTRAWFYMVAKNLYLNSVRKEKSKINLDELRNTPSSAPSILEKIISDENKRMCFLALQSLGETKREILVLQYFSGLSQKEIAAILHITPENVRVLAYRAKKELKKIMEVSGYEI